MCHIKNNLLTVAAITYWDLKVHFNKCNVEIVDFQGKVVGKETWRNYIYVLSSFSAQANVSNTKLRHERFGHLNLASLKEMHKGKMIVDLLEIGNLLDLCEACVMDK